MTAVANTTETGFAINTVEDAPEKSQKLLEGAQKSLGFVPNLFGVMSSVPALLEGYQTLSAIFGKTSLNATEQQVVLQAANNANVCHYCVPAHATISRMTGVADEVIEAQKANTPLSDPRLEALRIVSTRFIETRGHLEQADVQSFIDAGWTKENLLEVILGLSVKVMSNYTNAIAETPIDEAFQKEA